MISDGSTNAAYTVTSIYVDDVNGYIYANGFYQNSSRELKTNIRNWNDSALSLLDNVSIVKFNYKEDLTNEHIGFIAEDTPVELSTKNQNAMDTNNVIGILIKAVQELKEEIKKLKGEN